MKRVWTFMLMLGALAVSCDKYDDTQLKNQVENLEERVTTLEEWQKTANGEIVSLKSIIQALEAKDYVTSVESLSNGLGYVINFEKSDAITINHGTNGETPIITAKQDSDGKYYWTIDGEWLLDNDDNKIPLTGDKGNDGDKGDKGDDGSDGITPQLRINSSTNEWEVSIDNGVTWTSTGVKATGTDGSDGEKGDTSDSQFKSVDNTNPDYVIITLNDGSNTKIELPRFKSSMITFNHTGTGELIIAQGNTDIFITLKGDNITALYATMVASGTSVIPTKTATAVGGGLTVTKITGTQYKITLAAEDVDASTDKGVIKVTAVLNNGEEISRSIYYEVATTGTIVETSSADVNSALATEVTTDNTNPMSVIYTGDSSKETPEEKLNIVIPDAITSTTNKKDQPLTINVHSIDIKEFALTAPDGYKGDITITIPKGVKIDAVIAAPGSTVTITDGEYTQIIARTAANTLVVEADAVIEELVIEEGNVDVYGKVGKIIRHAENTDAKTIVKIFGSASVGSYGEDVVQYVAVTDVALNKATLELKEEKTDTLTVTFNPTDATNRDVTWSSSDETVATVVDGVVTAIKAGPTTITVFAENGKTATCEVTVKSKTVLGTYAIGDFYPNAGNPIGVVYWLATPEEKAKTGITGKIVAYANAPILKYAIDNNYEAGTDTKNGLANMATIINSSAADWKTQFPAFAWVDSLNTAKFGKELTAEEYYTDAERYKKGIYYLPAKEEFDAYILKSIFQNGSGPYWDKEAAMKFTGSIPYGRYLQSTAYLIDIPHYYHMYTVEMGSGDGPYDVRGDSPSLSISEEAYGVCAIMAF